MKILWLHPHFLHPMGGTRYVYEVVSRLHARADVTVAVEAASEAAREAYRSAGLHLYEISRRTSNSAIYWLLLRRYLDGHVRYLTNRFPEAEVVISSMFPMNWVAAQIGRPTVQLCYEPFAFFHDENFIRGFPPAKRMFIRLLKRWYVSLDIEGTRRSNVVLTLSKERQEWIHRVYQRDAEIIYSGVDTHFFQPTPNEELAQRYKGRKIILHSTDFTAIKGTEWLIRALPCITAQVPNVLVLITATVPDPAGLTRLRKLAASLGVADRIEFLGFVEQEMLPCYYTLADVVVQPSINQSHSLSVKEAMACGTPVVRSPDTKEEVIDGETGYLVDPRDTGLLGERIVHLLRDAETATRMGRAAREQICASAKYTWEQVADRFADILRATLTHCAEGS